MIEIMSIQMFELYDLNQNVSKLYELERNLVLRLLLPFRRRFRAKKLLNALS